MEKIGCKCLYKLGFSYTRRTCKYKGYGLSLIGYSRSVTLDSLCNRFNRFILTDQYILPEAVLTLGIVPTCEYGTPSTMEIPDSLMPYLQQHDAFLLKNHGALTVGADLITAYYRMESLELWAKIELTAHLLGGVKEISKKDIDTLIGMRPKYGVTGKHPGYKKYNK